MTPKNWWCEKCFQISSELATNGKKFTENALARSLARSLWQYGYIDCCWIFRWHWIQALSLRINYITIFFSRMRWKSISTDPNKLLPHCNNVPRCQCVYARHFFPLSAVNIAYLLHRVRHSLLYVVSFPSTRKNAKKKINQKRKIHLVLWQRFMNITYWSAYLKWRAHWANAHDNTFIRTLHNYEIDQRQPPSSSSTDSEKSIAETVHLRFSKTSTWMPVLSKTHIKRERERERERDLAKEKI